MADPTEDDGAGDGDPASPVAEEVEETRIVEFLGKPAVPPPELPLSESTFFQIVDPAPTDDSLTGC